LTSDGRQREIERLTEGKDPSFGYAVLAKLMSHKKYGRNCNAVLTVNFDDLVADALYLYTHKKPLIISHDSLVGFVRITRTRPLVIKLHGDALLQPRNTERETSQLSTNVKDVLTNFLSETALIFVGYGGNDKSIAEILSDLPGGSLPWGIYWVGKEIPENNIGVWLKKRNAIWVKHRDFDELMLLVWNEFNLDHPDETRFKNLTEKYYQTFNNLKNRVVEKPDGELSEFAGAFDKALEKVTSSWKVQLEANNYRKTQPEMADIIYQKGIEKFPNDYPLIREYAFFLHEDRRDYDKAEEYYKKALDIEPDNSVILANYAFFLDAVRRDYDKAEEYYKKALDIEPENAALLTNYAHFLYAVRKDYDKAEKFYKKIIYINPEGAISILSYANFLLAARKDYNMAAAYYQMALNIEPKNPCVLSNYAGLLIVNGDEKGFSMLQTAMELFGTGSCGTHVFSEYSLLKCLFHMYAHTNSSEYRDEALNRVREFLREGIRIKGWDFSDNLRRAIGDGHPHPEFLTQLSKVISDEIDIKELDKFEEWKENN